MARAAVACLMLATSAATLAAASDDNVSWRRPAAAVVLRGGERLAVANETTGTISLLNIARDPIAGENHSRITVLSETPVGRKLSALVQVPNTDFLLGADSKANELIVLRFKGDAPQRITAAAVAEDPENIAVAADGKLAAVASLWSRRLTLFEIETSSGDAVTLHRIAEIPLSFNPRLMIFLPDQRRLVVAHAFDGKVAVVDTATQQVESYRDLPGSNIRGLALSRDRGKLAVSHQVPNHLASTTGDDIHWGMLMQNLIRLVDVEAILDPEALLYRRSQTIFLGQPGAGEADPARLVELPSGDWLIAISGANEATITRPEGAKRARTSVGARPVDVVFDEATSRAFITNQLSDSVSVVDTQNGELIETVSLGPTPEPTPASRGERLFYSADLSHDHWLSCHSCHTEGHSTGHLIDTKSDGTFGTPKRILSLLGTRDANPWAWNGGFRELHQQVQQSVVSSMQGKELTSAEVNDLVAFLHTLSAPPPVARIETPEQQELVDRGRAVFRSQGCVRCHIPDLTYTSDAVYDVGLEDEQGLRKFNPPFLHGVSQRETLLHDGRAKSLREVFTDHSHPTRETISDADLDALVEFLRTL